MEKMTFEKAIKRLEEIAALLNEGAALEKSVELYEEATKLISFCTTALNDAQSKIIKLTELNQSDANN